MIEYRYQYTSLLKDYFYTYLDHKAASGQDVFSYAFLFKHVDKFLVDRNYDKSYINKEIYNEWLNERQSQVSSVTVYRESTMMRAFLIFTSSLGNECYIPILKVKPSKIYTPHVFSHEELQRLFISADKLRLKNRCAHNTLHMIPALFRLLYSTGIRLGEALELRNKDVNLEKHVLIIHKTKNHCERIAPINSSLESVLKEYVYNRNRIQIEKISSPDGYFFCGLKGQKATPGIVRGWFHVARRDAGIPYYGRQGGPNVHCFRHTACVHALLNMVRSGKDPYCCMPMLTAFMGHRDVKDTEYYIHLSMELYPDIIHLERNISSGVNAIISDALKNHDNENK